MKKSKKPLTLKKHTIRVLTAELSVVQGGHTVPSHLCDTVGQPTCAGDPQQ